MNELFLQCLAQARDIVEGVKEQYQYCENVVNCGTGPVQYTSESTRSMLKALTENAPAAIRAIADTMPYTAGKTMDISEAISPRETALQRNIYRDYGPEMNRIGAQIAGENELAAREADVRAIAGPGKQLVSQANELQAVSDPEFYKNRAAIGQAIDKYLSSYSPTELSPTEMAQISRGIGATGGTVTPSAMNTIKNAQTFGDAGTRRWQNFGNAVAQASSALPALRSGINAFEVATGRPLVSNTGESRLATPVQINPTSAMDTNFGFANNTLNQIGANQRAAIAKQKDTLDQVLSATQSFGNIVGGVGSFF